MNSVQEIKERALSIVNQSNHLVLAAVQEALLNPKKPEATEAPEFKTESERMMFHLRQQRGEYNLRNCAALFAQSACAASTLRNGAFRSLLDAYYKDEDHADGIMVNLNNPHSELHYWSGIFRAFSGSHELWKRVDIPLKYEEVDEVVELVARTVNNMYSDTHLSPLESYASQQDFEAYSRMIAHNAFKLEHFIEKDPVSEIDGESYVILMPNTQ